MALKILLHDAGTAFLRAQLRGGDYVAQDLLRLPLEQGSTFTFLPKEIDPDRMSLVHGGSSKFDFDEELNGPFVEFALDSLRSLPERALLFELGAVERGKESCNWPEEFQLLTCHSSVHRIYEGPGWTRELASDSEYGLVTTTDENAVQQLFQFARPFPVVGLITTMPSDFVSLPRGSYVDRSSLTAFAAAAQHIIVDAYDGEAFAIWSRQGEV